jgi:hypothetical protein
MKKPKTKKTDDAPAAGEVETPITNESDSAEEVEIITEEEAARRLSGWIEEEKASPDIERENEVDPKDQLAELEAIFEKLPEKLKRLRDLEALKAKYIQEIVDFNFDPLAEDAERCVRIRKSRENMVEMIDFDIIKIVNAPDAEKSRALVLVNDLAQCVRRAVSRDIVLLCEEVRNFAKRNPAVSFLFDDQDFTDDQIKNLPIYWRAMRVTSSSDNFNSHWRNWGAARMDEEVPVFMKLVRRVVAGERILFLPEAV